MIYLETIPFLVLVKGATGDFQQFGALSSLIYLNGNQGTTGLDFPTPAARLCDQCFSFLVVPGLPQRVLICFVLLSLRVGGWLGSIAWQFNPALAASLSHPDLEAVESCPRLV